ncbi:hypothetical protein AAE478_009197 [Parahypoxylon ruwenzoriense]
MTYFTIYCFGGLLVVFYLVRSIWSPLRSVPGPFLARFSDGWYLWRMYKGHFELDNVVLHKKYGSIVRYGPNRYSFDDPQASKIIYGHGTQFKKSSWYRASEAPLEDRSNMFAEEDNKRHALERKNYQQAYSMSALLSYEPYVDDCIELFSQRLTEAGHAGLPIDMGHWFQCYAFDVIGLMTYEKRYGFLDQGDDIGGVISALEDNLKYMSMVGVYSGIHWYAFNLMNWLAGEAGAGIRYVQAFNTESVDAYRADPKSVPIDTQDDRPETFLSGFFKKHEENPTVFTKSNIYRGCMGNVVAGSDTTAISLSATLYYLLKKPECFQKLRDEIDSRNNSGLRNITFKEAQDMPYLQAVIKEALRLHPATGLPLERVVPQGGATIAGRFFREGTIVGINSWVEHRNKSTFGEDAEEFRPERWLIDDKDRLAHMNRHWMPFGLGSRTCIGRHISMLEMTKLIPRIVRDFDYELLGGSGVTWNTANFWFVKPKGFKINVTRRNSKAEL